MTDITELAQRADRIISEMKLKHGDKDTYAPIMKWDEFLALVEALEKAQQRIAELEEAEQQLCAANVTLDARAELAKRQLAEMESSTVTVKLPKPHAHLIWIQAGHAPDDYLDDVAVSHSEKDRCCDGSERYPVYARWEIEEALSAAGIKWEAE